MKENRKKEIEAKLNQLIAETIKPQKTNIRTKSVSSNAKVIRRRKGNPDLHIT
jgi:hypothetical protein